MIGGRFYDVFATLDQGEKQGFIDFLHTSLSGSSEELRQLGRSVLASIKEKNAQVPGAKWLFDLVYPGQEYKNARMRLLFSRMLQLLHKFLAWQALQESPPLQSVLLLRELANRGLEPAFGKTYRHQQKQMQKHPHRDLPLAQYLSQVEMARFTEQGPRHERALYQSLTQSLDSFYLLGRLKLICAALNNQQVVDQYGPWSTAGVEALLASIEEAEFQPVIGAYHAIMNMLERPEEATGYQHLKAFLDQHVDQIPQVEAAEIFTYAQNYCIRQINSGNTAFLNELFLIYQNLLNRDLLLENGALSPWHVKNIVTVALRLEKFAWTESFIHGYIRLVPKSLRENARVYNLAKLEFHRKNYKQVKKLLQQVEYEDIFYNLDAKTILLKIYTEERDDVALDPFLKSFMAYLRRNKLIAEGHRERYQNLVRFLQRLANKGFTHRKELLAIQAELATTPEVTDIAWLRGQIEDLLRS